MSKNHLLLLVVAVIITCVGVTSAKPVTILEMDSIPAAAAGVGRFYAASAATDFPSQLARLTEYRATVLIPAASAVAVAPPPPALGTAIYAAFFG